MKYNYCSDCGGRGGYQIPAGDNRERFVCNDCSTIHYQNPLMVVGTIPLWIDGDGTPKVLLCKRAIEPRLGYWTLPAGFMEHDETCEEGAIRETFEEANAKLSNVTLYRMFNTFDRRQVHIYFRADMVDDSFAATSESSEVKLVTFDQIPWRELSFPSVYRALKDFIDDYPEQTFEAKSTAIRREDWLNLNTD